MIALVSVHVMPTQMTSVHSIPACHFSAKKTDEVITKPLTHPPLFYFHQQRLKRVIQTWETSFICILLRQKDKNYAAFWQRQLL